MIWELVKGENAWRELYLYVSIVAVMCLVLPENAGPVFIFVVGLCWIRSLPAERASLFQAGLPIAAADLFLARVLAFLALIWLPAGAGVAALLVSGKSEHAGGILISGVGLSVLVLATISHRVRELAGSHWASAISMAVFCAAAWPATLYVPRPFLAILCTTACVVLFALDWMRLPLSFEVVASKPAFAAGPGVVHREPAIWRRAPARSFVRQWLPVLRCAFPPTAFMFLPMIVMQNFGGQWFYASSQALFPVMMGLSRIAWLRGLPIARGTLLTVMMAPWLLVLSLNLLAGSLLFPPRTPIQFDYLGSNASSLRPPLEYWKIAPGGKAPVIEAPWHETWQPPVQVIAGVSIYNPYSTGASNSRRFFEWQYRRATLAIYGRGVEFADYRRPATLRPIEQQERFTVLNIAACLCWLLLLLNAVLSFMHWRSVRVFHRAAYSAGYLLLLPMLTPLFLEFFIQHPGGSLGTAVLNAVLLRLLALMPDGVTPVLLLTAVPVGLLCWSARRLFEGMEPQSGELSVRA